MDVDLSTAAASSVPLVLSGQTYRLSPLDDKRTGELDQWLRMRIMRAATEGLECIQDEETKEKMYSAAAIRAASVSWLSENGMAMLATLEGAAYMVFLGVLPNHPNVTPEFILNELSKPENLVEAKRAMDLSRGVSPEDSAKKNARKERNKERRKRRKRRKLK